MPNCFSLTRKGDTSPATLESVDRALCQTFELEYSARAYVYGWYDDIGFALACGCSLDKYIDRAWSYLTDEADAQYETHERMMLRFAAYLNEHYTVDAWGG